MQTMLAVVVAIATTVNAFLVGILAYITWKYTRETAKIARATEASAKATIGLAEGTVKQRHLSSAPWVFPDLQSGQVISGADIVLRNFGNGPALMLRAFMAQGVREQIISEWKRRQGPTGSVTGEYRFAALSPAGPAANWRHAFGTASRGEKGMLLVEYRDIYGNECLSGFEYQILDQDGHLEVIAGDLIGVEHRSAEF